MYAVFLYPEKSINIPLSYPLGLDVFCPLGLKLFAVRIRSVAPRMKVRIFCLPPDRQERMVTLPGLTFRSIRIGTVKLCCVLFGMIVSYFV